MRIKGKTIFITGASSGIGAETVKKLLERGANIANFSITEPEEYPAHKNYIFIKGDIRNSRKIKYAIKKTIKKFGNIDVLINNAAITQRKPFIKTSQADWDKIIGINIKGTLNITKQFLKEIEKLPIIKRVIINISSGAGLFGIKDLSIYSLTKAAIINFSQSLNQELAGKNIKVLTITPGSTNTQMFKKAFPNKEPSHTPDYVADIIIDSILEKIKPSKELIIDVFKHAR